MSKSPAPASPRRKILSSVGLVLALLASLVAFALPAGAESDDFVETAPREVEPVCKESYIEYKYERGDHGQPEIREYEYNKVVKGNIQKLWRGSWTNQGTFGWEPWPNNPPKWSQQNVAVLESGAHTATLSTWTSNGFSYRKRTTHYQYVPTGNSKVIQEAVPSTYERTGWVTEAPDGEGWVLIKQRERRRGAECPPPPEETERRELPNCPQGVVEIQTRSAIFVWTGGDKWYVGDPFPWTQDGWTDWMTIDTRAATAEECPPPPPPPPPPSNPVPSASLNYLCDLAGTVTLASSGGASDFVATVNGVTVFSGPLAGDTTLDFSVPQGGSALVVVTANGATILSQTVTHEACDVPVEPEPQPTDVGEEILGVDVEAGGAQADGVLPRTGGETGGFLLLASLLMSLGAVFRVASRRFS